MNLKDNNLKKVFIKNMNVPDSDLKRIVIIGAGFGGLEITKKLDKKKFQIILIDKNNYHTFYPLLYQVATAGLEPDLITKSIRSIIKNNKNFYFRLANVNRIDTKLKKIYSNIGSIYYDYLVIATGSKTNFFGNSNIKKYSLPIKSITEAINLRNIILENFEKSLITNDIKKQKYLMTFVIAGGGPTGVELAGSLSEFKKFFLPKFYPNLNNNNMNIHLIQATPFLLDGMSKKSSEETLNYLKKSGVNIWLNCPVTDYDGKTVYMKGDNKIESKNLIWAAGVIGSLIDGFEKSSIERNRLLVDSFNRVKNYKEIFAIGDIAIMKNDLRFPNSYPMTAQPAIQQGINLAKNLNYLIEKKSIKPFNYLDLGSMAIIGRNKAVCDFSFLHFKGFFAWLIWIFIHLIYLTGLRNKIITLINWISQYHQYNKSISLIIKIYNKKYNEKINK